MDHFKMEWRMEGKSKEEKKASDDIFKRYFKAFSTYMKKYGFLKSGAGDIMRITDLDVVEYIGLQKDMYGRKYFTVNYAIRPLCERSEHGMTIGYGDRIGSFYTNIDQWFGYLDEEEANDSFAFITQKLEQYVLPWFKERESKKALMTYVLNHTTGLNSRHDLLLARNLAMKFGEMAMAERCDVLYQQNHLPKMEDIKEYSDKTNAKGKMNQRFKKEYIDRQLSIIQKYNDEKEHIKSVGTEVYVKECEFNSAKQWKIPKAWLKNYEIGLVEDTK